MYDVLTRESTKGDVFIHLASSSMAHVDQTYSKMIEIDAKVVDDIGEGLEGSNKSFIFTSGTLVAAADPNSGETVEPTPRRENSLNEYIGSEQYALKQAKTGIKVLALRLAPYVYGYVGSSIRLLTRLAAQAGEIACVKDGAIKISTVHVDDAGPGADMTTRQFYESIGKTPCAAACSQSVADAKGKMGVFLVRLATRENPNT
ncbi:hypothetical protein F4818DRAFT_451509 [Hypoxylon cercidicola]|nr:hypothetical protein F4818DRAFT_451509 [Hypoxylon cercidicola]